MANVRKRYSAQEKAKIVLEVLKGNLTQSQIIAKYGVHNSQLYNWKKQALESIAAGFSDKQVKQTRDQSELIAELYQQIGQLKVELDWLKKNRNCSVKNRSELIDFDGVLSVRCQCELLDINRSSLYRRPKRIDAYSLLLMKMRNIPGIRFMVHAE